LLRVKIRLMDDIIPRFDDKRNVVFVRKLDSQYTDKFKPSAQHAILFQKRLSKGNVLSLEFFLNALCRGCARIRVYTP